MGAKLRVCNSSSTWSRIFIYPVEKRLIMERIFKQVENILDEFIIGIDRINRKNNFEKANNNLQISN